MADYHSAKMCVGYLAGLLEEISLFTGGDA